MVVGGLDFSKTGAISNCPGATCLVVARLGGDACLNSLRSNSIMECQHPLGNGAEVVVVELLALGRLRGAEQGSGWRR